MDTQSPGMSAPNDKEVAGQICHESFFLSQIQRGHPDKLGNTILEIFWCGSDYVVYRTKLGVFVNFADCPEREREQRVAFTEICPELCELRYLTSQMSGVLWFKARRSQYGVSGDEQPSNDDSLYDHNIAQAIMLLMEGKPEDAKKIAEAALYMAVNRSTNDNTIRYVRACMFAAFSASVLIGVLGYIRHVTQNFGLVNYCIASIFGIIGSTFSIITRVQEFKMKPCQQSNMNYWMSGIRVCIGLVGGLMLFLLAGSPLGKNLVNPYVDLGDWQSAALVGFLGGYAERLVPTIFRRTGAAVEESSGTPVQLARKSQGR